MNTLKECHLQHQFVITDFDYVRAPALMAYLLMNMKEDGSMPVQRLNEFRHIDSEYFLNEALDKGKTVLAEGAQGTMLDVDFGSYPFVTSSNTISAGVCQRTWVSPHRIGKIYGVFKAYCTRVGSGPFPTELHERTGEIIRGCGAMNSAQPPDGRAVADGLTCLHSNIPSC